MITWKVQSPFAHDEIITQPFETHYPNIGIIGGTGDENWNHWVQKNSESQESFLPVNSGQSSMYVVSIIWELQNNQKT